MTDEQKKIVDQMVELKDGKVLRVGNWLAGLALKLPQSIRYGSGDKKDMLVDHFTELIDEFGKNGKRGVLEYVDKCYDLVTTAIEEALPLEIKLS